MVNVAALAGAVIVTLLTLVAVATPMFGVVSVGLVPNTNAPLPVSSEITPASSDEDVVANADSLFDVVASVPDVGKVMLVAPLDVSVMELAPDVASVEPSAKVKIADVAGAVIVTLLILVAVAAPIVGVVKVGLVPNTNAPEPVSSEITPASCAEVVVANWLNGLLVRALPPPPSVTQLKLPEPSVCNT